MASVIASADLLLLQPPVIAIADSILLERYLLRGEL